MCARRIEFRAKHSDVMTRRELAAELERVDLGTCLMAGQKIVDDVKNAQNAIIALTPG